MNIDTYNGLMQIVRKAERLGLRKLANGVELIGHIPHIGPEGYFHVIFPPLDDTGIEEIESRIGRLLPFDLKEFYTQSNGILLFAYNFSIYGLRHSFVRQGDEAWQPYSIITPNTIERPIDSPESLVFIGSYQRDGSLLGMSSDSPTVYRFAPRSVTILNEWRSFDEMLLGEARRLSLLFDENGRKLDECAPTTPD